MFPSWITPLSFTSRERAIETGCPVSRLTLLFFGVAKSSGSSRNVTRRDSPTVIKIARQRPNSTLLSRILLGFSYLTLIEGCDYPKLISTVRYLFCISFSVD